MRRLALTVLIAAILVLPHAADVRGAYATQSQPKQTATTVAIRQGQCGESQIGPRASDCDFSGSGANSQPTNATYTSVTSPSVSGGSSSSGKRYVPYNRLSTRADGEPCATTGYVEEGTAPLDERSLIDPNPLESKGPNYRDVLEDYPPCPEAARTPEEPAPVETKGMVAARHWERVPLPEPKPSIAPGRAITGKPAYLETKGEVAHSYVSETVFGVLTIRAKGSYTVKWGDGMETGPHDLEGQAWPVGQIVHEYQTIGLYSVVVVEKWTATWSLAGESGVLRTLQTIGTIDNFPVEQIQAVIK